MPSYDPNALALNDLYKSSMAKATSAAAPVGVRTPRLAAPRPAETPALQPAPAAPAPTLQQRQRAQSARLNAPVPGASPLATSPGPRFSQTPAAKPALSKPNTHIAGRGGIPIPIAQAGHGRGAAPQRAPKPLAASTGVKLVQDANATTNMPAVTAVAPTAPTTAVTPPPGAPPALETPLDPSGNFRTLTGADAASALNSDNAGSATIQGRFLNKDGTRGPQETRAFTKAGQDDAAKRLNVVPGLFSGVSAETDQALSAARFAAADRGDFEAVERSYMTPEQKQATKVQGAENKILSAVGNAPLSQLPQVAQAVSGIQAGRTETALGGQTLQKGAMELQRGQQMQGMLDTLFNLDPSKPESKAQADTIIQTILAAQGKTPQQQQNKYRNVQSPVYEEGLQTGVTNTALNENTGEYGQPQGGQQAQPGAPQAAQPDGVYDMPGIGKVTVRGGIAYDDKGNILQ